MNRRIRKYCFVLCLLLLCVISVAQVPGIAMPKDTLVIATEEEKLPDGFLEKVLYILAPKKYKEKHTPPPAVVDSAALMQNLKDSLSSLLPVSIQAMQLKDHSIYGDKTEGEWSEINKVDIIPVTDTANQLSHIVYGYHPYWMGNAYESYNYSLLSRLAYFSYSLDPETGLAKSTHNWEQTRLVELAHKFDCKVDLCVTNFGKKSNTEFLNNQAAQDKMIVNVIKLISMKNADGLNIDFEDIPKSQKNNFTNFILKLAKFLHEADSTYNLTLAIPAIDWANIYDFEALNGFVDIYFVMGYDYYGSNSISAGPNAPLSSGAIWNDFNINETVNKYLEKGAPASRLVLGLPYYGKEWITETADYPSKSIKYIGPRTNRFVADNYASNYVSYFDTVSFSTFYIFRKDEQWHQCWTDDEYSLSVKYMYIKKKKLAGVGIWALGYDHGYKELWKQLKSKFTIVESSAPITVTKEDTLKLLERSLVSILSDSYLSGPDTTITKKNQPAFIDNFNDSMGSFFRVAFLVIFILIMFLVIGFTTSILDCNVRDILFGAEVKVYTFMLLLVMLIIIILRIIGYIVNRDIILIIGALLGVFTMFVVLSISRIKRGKRSERRP